MEGRHITITNGYATLAEFKARKVATTTDATDDSAIEDIITNASRAIDGITGRWFYSYTQTRLQNYCEASYLLVDAPLLSITTLTNGDGTVITSGLYNLLPLNSPVKTEIRLKASSAISFQSDSSGDLVGVISIAGGWGMCDRAATDPESVMRIKNTNEACILIALHQYNARYGNNISGNVQITAGGVVVTDYGAIPSAAWKLISPYRVRF